MTVQLTSEQVWQVIEKELFAVLGMVTARQEARTVGIVYVVRGRRLYIASGKDTWKVKHIAQNSDVSLTVPIHKGIPLMPWFKIPAATITFAGQARVLDPKETDPETLKALYRGMAEDETLMADSVVIEVIPEGKFLTYGVGVSLMDMRDPAKSRGSAPVGVSAPQRA